MHRPAHCVHALEVRRCRNAAIHLRALGIAWVAAAAIACGSDAATVAHAPTSPTSPTSPNPPTSPAAPELRLVSGQLVASGDVGPLTRVRITLRSEQAGLTREFSGVADASGAFRFEANVPANATDSLDLIVNVDADPRPFAPIYKRIASNDSASYRRPLLIATNVVIPSGTYAGSSVDVSLVDAFTPICPDASSPSCLAYFGLWTDVPVLWPQQAFPIPMAFFRRAGSPEITAEDSTIFWANVGALEAEFGRDLFRPVDISALGVVSPDGLPQRGNAVSIDPAAAPALAGAWVEQGRLTLARTRASSLVWLRQRYVMNHELVHVLGFGHTCAWESLMCGVSPGRPSATRGDVAAFLLGYRIENTMRTETPTTTLADALRGERILAAQRR